MVSSKDVAKLAGVSQTTVSRVLNTPELVRPKTVEKVMDAIKTLNYIPNEHARSLVQHKTGTIALLSGPLHNPFFVDTTTAIVNYANSKGYKVDVQFVHDEKMTQAYARFLERKVDGVILSCIFYEDPFYEQLEQLGIPYITYNRKHQHSQYYVEIDNEQAGYLAMQHLLALGHRRIAWIGGTQQVSTYANRLRGVERALQASTANAKLTVYHTDSRKPAIEEAIAHMLAEQARPTAVIGGADTIAIDALDCFLQRGLHVPEQMSVIGIDNVALAQHRAINLTTVGDKEQGNLGELAIAKLIENIENKNNCCNPVTKSVKLFCRETTATYR